MEDVLITRLLAVMSHPLATHTVTKPSTLVPDRT